MLKCVKKQRDSSLTKFSEKFFGKIIASDNDFENILVKKRIFFEDFVIKNYLCIENLPYND